MKPSRLLKIAGGARARYSLVARGEVTIDLGIGRRVRPLGPIRLDVAAPPEVVFDVIANPYPAKTPRAMEGKLDVLYRGGHNRSRASSQWRQALTAPGRGRGLRRRRWPFRIHAMRTDTDPGLAGDFTWTDWGRRAIKEPRVESWWTAWESTT